MFRLFPILSLTDSLPLKSLVMHVLLHLVKSLLPDISPRSGSFPRRYNAPLLILTIQDAGTTGSHIYQT